MLWKEVKSWASSHNYKVERVKIEGTSQKYDYFWEEKSNPNNKGQADSVFNLAKEVYNSITGYIHVEHQLNYKPEKNYEEVHKGQTY